MKNDVKDFVDEVFNLAQTDEINQMADKVIADYKANKPVVELKEADIFKAINASYIAERFFKRSRFWISQKINHNIKNGKPDDFTAEQRQTLKNALETIAFELQELADNM